MSRWAQGSIIGIEYPAIVRFYFNPATISIGKSPAWGRMEAAGREQPIIQYGCGEARTFNFELKLTRAAGAGYVRGTVESLLELSKPLVRGIGVDRPPSVRLILGVALKAVCVIDHVDGEYGPLFNPVTLEPYQGSISIALTEYK